MRGIRMNLDNFHGVQTLWHVFGQERVTSVIPLQKPGADLIIANGRNICIGTCGSQNKKIIKVCPQLVLNIQPFPGFDFETFPLLLVFMESKIGVLDIKR